MPSSKGKKMIEESVKIHDKFQFELKFTYLLAENTDRKDFNVETYMFIPNSLGVDPERYTKSDFYQDIQNYIRLKTPTMLLRDSYASDNAPLSLLGRSVAALSCDPGNANARIYTYRLKMFCSIFRTAMRDEKSFIERQQSEKDLEFQLDRYLSSVSEGIAEFRKLRNSINVSTVPEKNFCLYSYADEYLSLQMNVYLRELHFFLQSSGFRKSEHFMEQIVKKAKDEISYRKNAGYPSIPTEGGDNEALIFRRGALKKFVGSALFLRTKKGKEGLLIEHALLGLAAAFAMAFATSIAFFSKTSFEELTIAFFMILVASYMFKDRMKEILRGYISAEMRKRYYDHVTKIYSDGGQKIGILKQNFSFVGENNLPSEVAESRKQDFLSGVDEDLFGEKIIFYKKRITLFSKIFKSVYPDFRINGINDIIRFDLSEFTRKMDNPDEDVYIPKKNDYLKVAGARVYQMNLITRYSVEDGASSLNKFRITFNRNGIRRMEKIGL